MRAPGLKKGYLAKSVSGREQRSDGPVAQSGSGASSFTYSSRLLTCGSGVQIPSGPPYRIARATRFLKYLIGFCQRICFFPSLRLGSLEPHRPSLFPGLSLLAQAHALSYYQRSGHWQSSQLNPKQFLNLSAWL